ncbi:MAG: GntR family transcriptional regulator [Dehalococcoidia bacterium]
MLSLHVDRTNPLPLHHQLQHQLRAAIEGGRLIAGDALPSEHVLMAQAGVSRHTLRQAIDELVREGRLVRQRGRGTFVTEPPVAQTLGRFYSFARDQAAQGRHPTSRVLRFRRLAPAAEIGAALGLSRRDRVIEVVRLRLLDGEPVIYETSLLRADRVPGLTRAELAGGSIYDLLERRGDLRVSHAEEVVRAVALDDDVADALAVPRGSPGFAVERTVFAGESAVELRSSRIRGDRYSFRVHLPAEQLTAEP